MFCCNYHNPNDYRDCHLCFGSRRGCRGLSAGLAASVAYNATSLMKCGLISQINYYIDTAACRGECHTMLCHYPFNTWGTAFKSNEERSVVNDLRCRGFTVTYIKTTASSSGSAMVIGW